MKTLIKNLNYNPNQETYEIPSIDGYVLHSVVPYQTINYSYPAFFAIYTEKIYPLGDAHGRDGYDVFPDPNYIPGPELYRGKFKETYLPGRRITVSPSGTTIEPLNSPDDLQPRPGKRKAQKGTKQSKVTL